MWFRFEFFLHELFEYFFFLFFFGYFLSAFISFTFTNNNSMLFFGITSYMYELLTIIFFFFVRFIFCWLYSVIWLNANITIVVSRFDTPIYTHMILNGVVCVMWKRKKKLFCKKIKSEKKKKKMKQNAKDAHSNIHTTISFKTISLQIEFISKYWALKWIFVLFLFFFSFSVRCWPLSLFIQQIRSKILKWIKIKWWVILWCGTTYHICTTLYHLYHLRRVKFFFAIFFFIIFLFFHQHHIYFGFSLSFVRLKCSVLLGSICYWWFWIVCMVRFTR